MAETTIEWTDVTWNPVTGCDRISPGCDHCYALTMAKRLKAMGSAHYQNDGDPRTSGPGFGVTVHPDALDLPFRWRKPRRVFVNSMSDLFHPDVPDGAIAWVWHTMAQNPQHTFQILTKRPQRMAEWVERWNDLSGENFVPKLVRGPDATREAHPSGRGQLFAAMLEQMGEPPEGFAYPTFDWMGGPLRWGTHPLPNVWLGTSIESDRYSFRADHLRRTPAAVWFISAEPLLGPLPSLDLTDIDWLIVGGESGRGARPMHPDWVRDLRDRCVPDDIEWVCAECGHADSVWDEGGHYDGVDGVLENRRVHAGQLRRPGPAFFFKQWGEWAPGRGSHGTTRSSTHTTPQGGQPSGLLDLDGVLHTSNELSSFTLPAGWVRMARQGKKAAGRVLDGRTWDEMP